MKDKNPTIVIVNGANWLGSKLVELLLEQNGNVIVVDDFVEKNMPFIKKFNSNKHFIFIEKERINTLRENFTQIKYFVHLKNDFNTSDDKISSKTFVQNTKFIDEVLSIALEKNSVYLLTSSIHLHKDFLLKKNFSRESENKNAYNESDLQNYIEKTVQEYISKAGLNGRIVRLGNIYGPGMDIERDPVMKRILSDAINTDSIRIYGDGLQYVYYVYISDAIQGILRVLFNSDRTLSKIYSITNPEEISILSIANKILALQPKARKLKFIKVKNSIDPLYERAYIPEENLSEIGWKPNVNFDRGISQVYEFYKRDSNFTLNFPADDLETNLDLDQDSHISFSFDDTINLSNSQFTKNNEVEDLQFQKFHQQINDSSNSQKNWFSSLFGKKTQKNPINSNYEEEIVKTKSYYAKLLGVLVFFLIIYIFFFIPIFRLGTFFYKFDKYSGSFANALKSNSQIELIKLSDTAKNGFDGIDWAIDLFNQENIRENITNTSLGIENANLAYNLLQNSKLKSNLDSNSPINEEDIIKSQDLLLLLNTANNQLRKYDEIKFPGKTNDYIKEIYNWSLNTEKKIENKMKS